MTWTLARKIAATIGVLLAVAVAASTIVLATVLQLQHTVDEVVARDSVTMERSANLRHLVLQLRRAEKDISIDLSVRPENVPKRLDGWLKLADEAEQASRQLQETPSPEVEAASKALADYLSGVRSAIQRQRQGELASTAAFEGAIDAPKKLIRVTEEKLTQRIADLRKNVETGRDALFGQLRQVVAASVGGLVVSLISGIALGFVLTRGLSRQLRRLSSAIERVWHGDLDQPAEVVGKDELAEMSDHFNGMLERVRSTVLRVRSSSESMSVASAQVASGNADLSSRTEQAASHLQETASTMDELNGAISQSADAAQRAREMAAEAVSTAERGSMVVSEAVAGMEGIRGSSQRIAEIIGLIDSIAFQTNILALNAAVEAARAGEQGRGFAVVASEVRALAARSANAAKEIKTLITTSVEQVDVGAARVTSAGRVMQDLTEKVSHMRSMFDEIGAGAIQQREGIGQVNAAVNELDQMTQQNAALVEEAAAAAISLKTHCDDLRTAVEFFRVSSP